MDKFCWKCNKIVNTGNKDCKICGMELLLLREAVGFASPLALEIGSELIKNCDDQPIYLTLLDRFDGLDNRDKRSVVEILLGSLSACNEMKGYSLKRSK